VEQDRQALARGPIPVVTGLLIANGLIYVMTLASPFEMIRLYALWPPGMEGDVRLPMGMEAGSFQIWQLVTHAFLHGGLFHLFVNMFVLWMFGAPIERLWGSGTFLAYYAFSVLGAGLVQATLGAVGALPPAPSLGASGGVFAILLAFGLKFPNQTVVLLIPPIPMKAKYFVIFIGVVELIAGVFGTQQGIAHFAHLAGMVFGLLFIALFRPDRSAAS
jgi:membrane associated rhomboid family serine protease